MSISRLVSTFLDKLKLCKQYAYIRHNYNHQRARLQVDAYNTINPCIKHDGINSCNI